MGCGRSWAYDEEERLASDRHSRRVRNLFKKTDPFVLDVAINNLLSEFSGREIQLTRHQWDAIDELRKVWPLVTGRSDASEFDKED